MPLQDPKHFYKLVHEAVFKNTKQFTQIIKKGQLLTENYNVGKRKNESKKKIAADKDPSDKIQTLKREIPIYKI